MDYTPFYQRLAENQFFVTGCTHFQHKNICRGTSTWDEGYRDFNTIEEMDDLLINNINKVVPYDAYLFMLGDSLFGDKTRLASFLSRINCVNKIYVYGNHSKFIRQNKIYQDLFKWCGDYVELSVGGKFVCMSHYPFCVWNESHKGSWMLHSHSHGTFPDNVNQYRIDVGMDTEYFVDKIYNKFLGMTTNFNKSFKETYDQDDNRIIKIVNPDMEYANILHNRFHPFSFSEISKIMSYKKCKPVDHHDSETN